MVVNSEGSKEKEVVGAMPVRGVTVLARQSPDMTDPELQAEQVSKLEQDEHLGVHSRQTGKSSLA